MSDPSDKIFVLDGLDGPVSTLVVDWVDVDARLILVVGYPMEQRTGGEVDLRR